MLLNEQHQHSSMSINTAHNILMTAYYFIAWIYHSFKFSLSIFVLYVISQTFICTYILANTF